MHAASHGSSIISGACRPPSVNVGSRYESGEGPSTAAARLASPCGALNNMKRCGRTTPLIVTARLTVNNSAAVVRAAADRNPFQPTAIIGASSGTIGTRNRAGALDPPHHMYIRVELATKAATIAVNVSPNQRSRGLRSITQHPAMAIA